LPFSSFSEFILCSYPASFLVLVIVFASGSRYVLTGTKDGHLQVADTASGDLVVDLATAHAGAIWSLCVRPDGRGFASASADKDVKFWDFTVESGGVLGIALARQLTMAQVGTTVLTSVGYVVVLILVF
jgi:WD40 repeat protein